MVMLGSGVVWGDDQGGRIAVVSINGSPASFCPAALASVRLD
jgi:hypothetical protein